MKTIQLITLTILFALFTTSANAILLDNANLSYQHSYNDTDGLTRIGVLNIYFNNDSTTGGWTNDDSTLTGWSIGSGVLTNPDTVTADGTIFRDAKSYSGGISVSAKMKITGSSATTSRFGLALYRDSTASTKNYYNGYYDRITGYSTIRIKNSGTYLSQVAIVDEPADNVEYNYVFMVNSSGGLKYKHWQLGTTEPDWTSKPSADTTYTSGLVGIFSQDVSYIADNFSVRNVTAFSRINVGNVTGKYIFPSGTTGSQMSINYTLGNSTTDRVDAYASIDNSTWTLVSTGIVSNTLTNIPLSAKNQTQYIRATLNGGNASSPNYINMSVTSETTTTPSTTITVPANSWVMFNNWTYDTNFSRIASNESNDIAYSWYNTTTGDFDSFYIGNTYGQSTTIPKSNSVLGFFNAQTNLVIPTMTPLTTNVANGWNMLYVEGTSNRTLQEIKNNMEASLCNNFGLYRYNTTTSLYSDTLTESLQPNEGFLVYIDGGCTWVRTTI